MRGIASVACATPAFEFRSSDPIKLYLVNWLDRDYSYSSFEYPPKQQEQAILKPWITYAICMR